MIWPRRRRRREAELDEEIQGHLAMASHDREARGGSPREAAYAARREFGNATLVKEVTRQAWGGVWLDQFGQDVRLALRSLRRMPAFTMTVVVLLGLGLGGAAAMYGILDRLLLRAPEQVRDPDGLFSPYITHAGYLGADVTRGKMQWREYRLLAGGIGPLTAAYTEPSGHPTSVGGDEVQAQTVEASVGYFEVLGVRPLLGRFFLPEDSASTAPSVAAIGYGFWQRQFGGARNVLGKTFNQGSVTYTIVGVAPRGFSGATPERVDVWLPAERAAPAAFGSEWRVNNFTWQMVARVISGRSRAQAVAAGFIRLRNAPEDRSVGGRYKSLRALSIVPGRALAGPGSTMQLSYLVTGASVLVALISLANAAGLLLLRALRRERETAVRLVLGVSRAALLRSVAVESTLLALLGGAVACAVAAGAGELLRRLLLRVDWAVPVVDGRAAGFVLAASLVIGFVTGLLPGWLAGRPDTVEALKAGPRAGGIRRASVRSTLLVVQSALSVALLTGLALCVRSFERARAFDFGPDVDHVLVAELQEWTPGKVTRVPPAVYREVEERVAALPGVTAVAAASSTPLAGYGVVPLRVQDVDSIPRSQYAFRGPYVVEATRSYFDAAGLSLLRGRLFADQISGAPQEAVVSEEFARVLWPGANPLGRCLYIGHPAPGCTPVVGIVRNVRWELRDGTPSLTYYVPLTNEPTGPGAASLIVRSDAPGRLVPLVRTIVASVAGVRSPSAVRTLRDVVDPQFRRLRQGLTLFGIFAALAVIVAMFGMYSVVAYSVTQRAHEFGIRVALGARAANLVRLVVNQALAYAGAGLLVGLLLSILGARYVAPLLYQTSPRDPLALLAAALALVVAALAACVVPAHAATRADPRQALQAE
ncbi:MAG: ABC transporter permease [Gemmatimonadales bacterium]